MITLQELKTLFQEPRTFFKQRSKETFDSSLFFALLVRAISSLSSIFYYIQQFSITPVLFGPIYLLIILGSLAGLFIGTGIIHLSLRIFGGQGSYEKTFQSYVYGHLPSFLWATLLNIIGYFFPETLMASLVFMFLLVPVYIYSVYLTIVGLSLNHKMSMGRAFLAWLIPSAIFGIITIIILVLFFTIAAVTTTTGI